MSDVGSFWARRRAAVKAEEEADVRATQEAELAEAQEGKSDAEVLEDLGLPDPATLQKGDDFSGFMASGVPEHLRRIALRTLWRSNPVLANIDGLNEYDDDYRAAMLLSEPVKTAYQVGKGMKAHLDEMARKAAALEEQQKSGEADSIEAELEIDELEVVVEESTPVDVSDLSRDVQPVAFEGQDFDDETVEEIAIPRRMRFRFEEASA